MSASPVKKPTAIVAVVPHGASETERMEITPLLSDSAEEQTKTPTEDDPRRRTVTLLILAALVMVGIAGTIMIPATQAVMEDIICNNHFSDHSATVHVEDVRCKAPAVQKEMAMLRSWSYSLQMIIPVLVQVPYGVMADVVGRRPVVLLSWVGLLMGVCWDFLIYHFPNVLPIWLTLTSSAFLLIGGGPATLSSLFFVVLSDVVPAADRSAVFMRAAACQLITSVVFHPLAAYLLGIDAWMCLYISLGLFICAAAISTMVPETLPPKRKPATDDPADSDDVVGKGRSPTVALAKAWAFTKETTRRCRTLMFTSKMRLLLLAIYSFAFPMKMALTLVMLQYITSRYMISWSMAFYWTTVSDAAAAIGLLVAIPAIAKLLTVKFHFGPLRRDTFLMRFCAILMLVGTILISVSFNPWVFTVALVITSLGNGISLICRGIFSAMVEPDSVATIFTLLSLGESLNAFYMIPVFGWLQGKGIELGGPLMALPFMVMAGIFALVLVMSMLFKVPRSLRQGDVPVQ